MSNYQHAEQQRRDSVRLPTPMWLVVGEIFIWLPSRNVLRCRVVCKSWLSSTSTDVPILNHHRRQASLPIIKQGDGIYRISVLSVDSAEPQLLIFTNKKKDRVNVLIPGSSLSG